ncbi:NADH-quinone oxidoreductase subunit NuoF family protein [Kitasatospora sp. NPDC085879]|uniref:NADH-quinone oxidoreductase subunit NuoF family protein n=1 Tax=Kitasatospora sp. NPDC085879 TaxID=3154769 RepID=UPI000BB13285|nr:NADH-quinone oxidoreductase subunit NuoF family protein [Streptomyces sp. TLI_235]PBC75633.1 NADH:ubiquinone oxidoreductase subunit F (NADH-binding) [Streptomyces sp. TLI_235]
MSGAPIAWIGRPVLFAGLEHSERLDHRAHLVVHGGMPAMSAEEVAELSENVNLRGRGGAGFPFARKIRAVVKSAARRRARPVVVVNGTEGEPSCLKDAALLLRTPHLVLDGALLAAEALDAEQVVLGVTRADTEQSLRRALDERRSTRLPVSVARLPERFVSGEGSSLARGITSGIALPRGGGVRTSDSGVGGLPTLLSNAETYAQLAVAARLGALPYREVGTPSEPGTVLLTLAGSQVVETPTGVPLVDLLALFDMDVGQGVLTGGYHGTWLTPEAARTAQVSRQSLQSLGGALGAGAILPLPATTCPLGEALRVARWMADETAGQCGPCYLGLPALVKELEEVVRGGGRAALDRVETRMRAVTKRGACSHPDAASRFVASALEVFDDDLQMHSYQYGCGRPVQDVLPMPVMESAGTIVVDWTLCEAHGLCTSVLPEVISLAADGFPSAAVMPVPPQLLQQAARAVDRCPALALRIQ